MSKLTDLTALATLANGDLFMVVDVSDTSMDATGTNKYITWSTFLTNLSSSFEVPLTFSTGLTRTVNTITVNTTQNITKLSNLTSNGFVKTSGGDGTLSIDTNTYLTSASIDDTAYGVGWDADTTHAPSKNAVYDKINAMISDTVYGAGWNGDTTVAPSKNAVYDEMELRVPKSLYDAHTVLYATTDNTPVALTVSEQTVVGRATGGNISAIAIDSDLSSVSANHDTVPSAKATKAYADLMLPLTGGTMSGNITLGENTSIALDPAGSADGKYSGITVTGTAGYTQAFGDLVYLDPTDSRWEKTDANSASGADGDARGMLGMVVSAGTDGNACTILLNGIIRADATFPTFTVNNPIYVSETAGAVTQTQPTTTDVVIRIVGSALTTDEMYFNPDWAYTTHT
jgi:hypothetical protein